MHVANCEAGFGASVDSSLSFIFNDMKNDLAYRPFTLKVNHKVLMQFFGMKLVWVSENYQLGHI